MCGFNSAAPELRKEVTNMKVIFNFLYIYYTKILKKNQKKKFYFLSPNLSIASAISISQVIKASKTLHRPVANTKIN